MITAEKNAQLKNIALLLKKSKERIAQGVFIVEGKKMFEEALALGLIKKAFFSESFLREHGEYQCEYECVKDDIFDKIAETVTPQGVIALVNMPHFDFDECLKKARSIVVLEALQDPGNMGTIIRTAEAAGIDMIVASSDSVNIYNPKVVRSTMGSILRMPVFTVPDIYDFTLKLNDMSFNTIAASLKATKDYTQADFTGKSAVFIGNEGNGLTEKIVSLVSEKIIIPMSGHAESLNASVAAALMMYEIKRNRQR